jgi:hypothetical protein
MKLKDFKDLLARVPKEYEIEPMAIITDPINKKIMLMPMGEEPKDEAPKVESKSNPIGFA